MSKSKTTPDWNEKIAREAFPFWFAEVTTSGCQSACHLTECVINAITKLGGTVIFPMEGANAKSDTI